MCSGWTPKVVARATRAPASRSALETAAPPHFAVVAIGFVCHESTFFLNEREKKRSECQRSVDGAKRRESDPSRLGSASGPNDERRRGAARTKKKNRARAKKKNRNGLAVFGRNPNRERPRTISDAQNIALQLDSRRGRRVVHPNF
jgi:hypothetical protein